MHTEYRIKVFDARLELWSFSYVDDKLMDARHVYSGADYRRALEALDELLAAGNAPRG
jgi:hypothetical protein